MAEELEIGVLAHGGTDTTVLVEESRTLRRITIRRYRLVFGERKKMGEVHIYPDEVGTFQECLSQAKRVMDLVAEKGFKAVVESLDGEA